MKKMLICLLAVGTNAMALDASPFVGAERENNASIAYVGIDVTHENLELSISSRYHANTVEEGRAGNFSNYKLESTYGITGSMDFYTEIDFNQNLSRGDTKFGVKYRF